MALEGVVQCWNAGQSPESLSRSFSLDLQQVYAVIAYYLRHRDVIDAYVQESEVEGERLRAEFEREYPPKVTAEELKRRWAERHAPVPG